MKNLKYIFLYVTTLAFLLLINFSQQATSSAESQTQPAAPTREDAYRLNNIGVALLEQFKYQEAADVFRRALQIDQKLALSQINLSIALFNLPDLPGAAREAQTALALAPNAPQPAYILGLIAKTQSRIDEAITHFQKVLKIDPNDVGTNINLGQIYSQQRKYPEAIAAFRVALTAEPYNATALYNMGQALLRSGQREEGLRATARFSDLRQRGSATTLGTTYLEQGRYAEAVASTGLESELVDRTTPAVKFVDANNAIEGRPNPDGTGWPTAILGRKGEVAQLNEETRLNLAKPLAGRTLLFDVDNDGDLDLLRLSTLEQRLYRNDSARFTDITAQSPALAAKSTGILTGAIAGDYDNDGNQDVLIIRSGGVSLYRNDGAGKFSDVSATARIPAYSYLSFTAAFVDLDHDGDLDIFIAGLADLSKTNPAESLVFPLSFAPAPNLVLRNDGAGKFTDITTAAGFTTSGHTIAVVPTDFNNRRDIDLLLVNFGKPLQLFSNQRDGTFRDVSKDVGLDITGNWSCVAAGDFNKDGFTDFFLGRTDAAGLFAMSDGREKFRTTAAPAGTEVAHAAQFLDYDNDGLLDCLVLTDKGLQVLRNVGTDWVDTTAQTFSPTLASLARSFSTGDVDNDGDQDVVLTSPDHVAIALNDGGNRNHSLRLNLAGKVSNRSGIGTKIEARAGSLVQKLETSSTTPAVAPSDVLFGFGRRSNVDAVRLLWPSGVVQAETEIPKPAATTTFIKMALTELDRKPSSCPYLYTWNGERFEFVTDFLGGGEMGYLHAPGHHNTPDPTEYVRIRGDQLKARNGRYELRVTNELEEAIFADQFQLIAIDHPASSEVFPNEGMTDPPRPFKLFVTRDARPPLTAVDHRGHDVLSHITKIDRIHADNFRRDRIRGYAEEHSLTLKVAENGAVSDGMVLLLTGWTDYAWSSDNLAAFQAGKSMKAPALQVKDTQGRWRSVIDNIGIPVGRPQTVTVDLSNKFLSASREVRIVTNMRILWDQIQVAVADHDAAFRMTQVDPATAHLRWRGFSREITPDGREPFGYDYEKLTYTSPWKVMPGRYTREGEVRELLVRADDMFVIFRPGDEISLSFDAHQLPAQRPGWTRTFLLYANGYSKEMDINSAIPDQVLPLPFRGMTRYPYPDSERYPMTAERRAYIDKYNTRVVTAELPSIDTLISWEGFQSTKGRHK